MLSNTKADTDYLQFMPSSLTPLQSYANVSILGAVYTFKIEETKIKTCTFPTFINEHYFAYFYEKHRTMKM